MAVVLACNTDLGGEMNRDAQFVFAFLIVCEVFQVVHRLVFCQHSQVGGDVVLAIDGVAAGELVVKIKRKLPWLHTR